MADSNFIGDLKTQLQKLNEPELTALRTDVDALKDKPVAPSPKAYITETGRSASGWWRKYSDGFIEQGGVVSFANAQVVNFTVNFAKAFSNTNYGFASIGSSTCSSNEAFGTSAYKNKKTTAIAVYISGVWSGHTMNGASWFACGY